MHFLDAYLCAALFYVFRNTLKLSVTVKTDDITSSTRDVVQARPGVSSIRYPGPF